MSTRAQPDPERTEPAAAIDIVIVNWNAGALLRTCLDALGASNQAAQLNVIVVDNASTDSSAQNLEMRPLRLSTIHNDTNRGFAAACNQGAASGSAPLILFLNPDVRVDRDAISRAADFLGHHADTGIVGIRLLDRSGETARNCARRPTVPTLLLRTLFLDRIVPSLVPPHFVREWDHRDTRAVDQVMGAFLLIRRDLFDRLAGFDERFFVYYEDLDLCLRVIDGGYKVVHLTEATAVHDGGGTTSAVKDRRLSFEMTSRVLFMHKWHGATAACALLAMIVFLEIPLRIVAELLRSPRHGWMVLRGAGLFWRNAPRLIRSIFMATPRATAP
jgi:N-acetylglucosaminyl-diphospho-decaprenol L-rhamnosyltransferase